MNNEQYRPFFAPNLPLLKGLDLTVHDIIINEPARNGWTASTVPNHYLSKLRDSVPQLSNANM